jgi:hypothetical protein
MGSGGCRHILVLAIPYILDSIIRDVQVTSIVSFSTSRGFLPAQPALPVNIASIDHQRFGGDEGGFVGG